MLENVLFLRVSILLALCLALLAVILRARVLAGQGTAQRQRHQADRVAGPASGAAVAAAPATDGAAFHDADSELVVLHVHRLALAVAQFNYQLGPEHLAVLAEVRAALPTLASRRDYMPRRPQIIPRLLVALRDGNRSSGEIAELIVEDPLLGGEVLRLANSPFYRVSVNPVDSIARAVTLLGSDGLRALIASAVLQPGFRLPGSAFPGFADSVWDLAGRAACAAQRCARRLPGCDPFAAHLLVLLQHLAWILIARLVQDAYATCGGLAPRPEVVSRLLDDGADELACRIAQHWELPEPLCAALAECRRRYTAPLHPLARVLHLGRLGGSGSLLVERAIMPAATVSALLVAKGMNAADADAILRAGRDDATA